MTDKILRLSGITTHSVYTIGYINTNVLGCPAVFHVVEDKLSITQAGVLCTQIFQDNKANINYEEKILELIYDFTIPFHMVQEKVSDPHTAPYGHIVGEPNIETNKHEPVNKSGFFGICYSYLETKYLKDLPEPELKDKLKFCKELLNVSKTISGPLIGKNNEVLHINFSAEKI